MTQDTALMAHLLRRAGFGATKDELDQYVAKGYEATVEELLHPELAPPLDEDVIRRYHVDQNSLMYIESCQAYWMYRMINTQRPLEEKMALFWHGLFATAYGKLNHAKAVINQTNTFRREGLGSFANLLRELSRDPAMIFWLDNKDNHKDAPNENFGRELLELFSMGIGNYTEEDVKACARAFTGWTIRNADYMSIRASRDSIWPSGRLDWQFQYLPEDHDDSEKKFLGHTGRFNGDDIIDIITQHPASSWFIAGQLHDFFISDTPNEAATQYLTEEFRKAKGDIRSVMRSLFLSDFFRSDEARFARVKSPAELVAGTARLAGGRRFPEWSIVNLSNDANFMGQEILNPPTVEGWHTGQEWVDTGTLVERVNSATLEMGDATKPGVQTIIGNIKNKGPVLSPREFVEACLDEVGCLTVSDSTLASLESHAKTQGDLKFRDSDCAEERVTEMLQLILSTREYQMA
ncbi:MAG: hypothetical protein BZY81_00880 [SAR202 cluster bacterium Io17-Chloro-G4]|nr:MAG: hypothetical protein BZY81_00880 [SAR202 cluster bacterium Io17-Chloro-G4]